MNTSTPQTTEDQTTNHRFYDIDLLRFFAALVVVLYHYTFRGYAADQISPIAFPQLSEIFRYGYLGVDLFFIVSGFVILLSAQGRTASAFTISRIARLYPGYWACVSMTALTIYLFGGDRFNVNLPQYLVNLTMLQEFVHVRSIDGVYWTLAVELRFYFLVFLLIAFGQLKRTELYMGAWFIVTCYLLLSDANNIFTLLLFPRWSFYFIAGALFYQIYANGPSRYRTGLITLCFVGAVWQSRGQLPVAASRYGTELDPLVIALLIGLMFALFSAIALRKTGFISHPFLFYLGILTYPLYLLHENIGFIIIRGLSPYLPDEIILVLTTLLMCIVSWLVYLLVERPGGKWLRQSLTRLVASLRTPGKTRMGDKA